MTAAINITPTLPHRLIGAGAAWPVALGLAALYAPTYFKLATGAWQKPEYAHGFIILVVALGLLWKKRRALLLADDAQRTTLGALLLGPGLLMYVLGRSQDILLLEVGSQLAVFSGVILLLKGAKTLRELLFPVMFLVFLVPLPSFIIDYFTGPLKHYISLWAEQLLYWFGYPVARSGVTLSIGPYQLLVDDACSGIYSLFALSALGALFIHLRGRMSTWHNAALLIGILPIALLANTLRVIALVLVTYHLGDEAGQGFLHDLAGLVEFSITLSCLFLMDQMLSAVNRGRTA
ncbi:MAG: exosortase B [Pseudomonadota bacterium]